MPAITELTPEEKLNLKPSKDGKVHIFNNGIFNDKLGDPKAAAKYANQMANSSEGEVYMIHFPQADSVNNATDAFLNTFGADGVISELMVAGFQHYLEGGIADASHPSGLTKLSL